MKKLTLICGAACALFLAAACSSPAPANNSGAASNANAANRNAAPAANTAASPAASPAANANNANSSSAAAAAAQDFTLVNDTGVEIDKVYISPHDADDWEEDILGKDTLPTGESVEVKFDRDETAAKWDLRVEDKQGNGIEWENLDLLKISKLTLHYKDNKPTAEAQ
jgi:pyruvate/2-oxoglutarate dehydrogenase complex dihydrolipoamide acyltransferase (E2) component